MHHLTITTGDSRYSPRDEVDASLLDRLLPCLAWVGQGWQPMPAVGDGYQIRMDAADRALMATIAGTVRDQRCPLITMGVAGDAECAPALWIELQRQAEMPASGGLAPGVQMPPDAPWLAVVLWQTITLDPASAAWLGDAERCIAWAWIDGLS